MILLLLACADEPAASPELGAAVCENPPSWNGDVEPFLRTWCTSCHASTVTAEARHGAPVGVDFDVPASIEASSAEIANSVAPESARMPPGGGPSEAERDEIVRWITCGMPDLPDPAPVLDPCTLPTVRTGDVLLTEAPCATASGLVVTGDLVLDGDGDASCICAVDGDVRAAGASSVTLSRLGRVGGVVDAGGVLGALSLPVLTRIGGSLTATDGALTTLRTPVLTEVGGEIHLARVASLGTLDISRLAEVGGSLVLDGVDALPDADRWTGLEHVGGDLLVRDNLAWTGDAPWMWLERVDGRVEFADDPALVRLDGLAQLASTPELALHDLPALTAVGGLGALSEGALRFERLDLLGALPDLGAMTLADALVLRDAPLLVDLGGLDTLTEVDGDLVIEGCDGLNSLAGLAALTRVGGDLVVTDLPALTALDLPALTTVEGDVVLRNLPALEAVKATALVGQLSFVGGEVTVEAVGP